MSERRYVCGRDCTITLLQDNTYTAIPFVSETLRCVPNRFALHDTLASSSYVAHENGYSITGTVTSLLTETSVLPLLTVLHGKSFDLLVKRGSSKVIYKNLVVQSFEIRGRLDEHLYLKLDIASTKKSYATTWDGDTVDLSWQRETVFSLRRKNFTSDYSGLDCEGIYYFVLRGDLRGVRSFTLTIHFVLPNTTVIGKTLIEKNTLESLTLNIHRALTIEFEHLRIEHDMFDVQSASEILLVRNYAIEADVTYTFETETSFVEGVL